MSIHFETREVIGLMSLGLLSKEKRDAVDENEFFGFSDIVAEIKAQPVPTLRRLLLWKCGWEWDGQVLLFDFMAEQFRCECLCEKACRMFGRRYKEIGVSYAYLDHFYQMSNWRHDPGSPVIEKVKECRRILIDSFEVVKNIEAAEPRKLEVISSV